MNTCRKICHCFGRRRRSGAHRLRAGAANRQRATPAWVYR